VSRSPITATKNHDTLPTDPIFKLIAGRSPTDADLAGQPTLSRFENQVNIARGLAARKTVSIRPRPRGQGKSPVNGKSGEIDFVRHRRHDCLLAK
jgi:hypothetical protein